MQGVHSLCNFANCRLQYGGRQRLSRHPWTQGHAQCFDSVRNSCCDALCERIRIQGMRLVPWNSSIRFTVLQQRWTNQPSILPGEHIIPSPPLFETHPLSTIHYASTSARSSPMRGPFGPNNPHLRLANSLDFAAIHPQTSRMAIIIDRFTVNGTITFVFNDMVLPITNIVGRHFFDFVSEEWEKDVRDCIEMVKGWGVNERGQPSDGGFGYGGFALCLQGRKSL